MTLISLPSILVLACAAWWMLSVTVQVLSAALALIQPVLARRNRRLDQPPVSVLVPVNESGPQLEPAFTSVFAQAYPQFEVVISATNEAAPALAVGRMVASRFPKIESRIVIAEVRVAVSPKLNNLAAPLVQARNDLVLIKDSNVVFGPGHLAELVRALTAGVGVVGVPKIAREPKNFAAEIECAFLNGYQARLLLAASALGLGFGIGASMLFDRREFVRAGGVEAIAGTIAEDHALSKVMARAGWRTVLAGSVVTQSLLHRQLSTVWNRQLRWTMCRRIEEPLAFLAEPFFGALFTVATGAIGAAALGLSACVVVVGTLLVWFLTEAAFLKIKGWHLPRSAPLPWICRECLVPALWIRAWSTERVFWGDSYVPVRRR